MTAQPARIPAEQGAAIYAWTLRRIETVDASLSRALHDSDGLKPLTTSTLQDTGPRDRGMVRLVPQRTYSLRLTTLDETVGRALLAGLRQADPAATCLELGGACLRIQRVMLTHSEHAWAAATRYAELLEQHTLSGGHLPDTLTLQFHSPTLFRINGQDQPLCHPAWVFGSYLRQWQAFAPLELPSDLGDYIQQGVTLGRFELSSGYVPVEQGHKGGHVGFMGRATFRLRIRDTYYMRLVHLLAAYSFWCGTGYRTTVGLGQTSLLPARTR